MTDREVDAVFLKLFTHAPLCPYIQRPLPRCTCGTHDAQAEFHRRIADALRESSNE